MGQKLAPIQSGVMKDNKVFQVVTVIINLIAPKGLHEFVSACIGKSIHVWNLFTCEVFKFECTSDNNFTGHKRSHWKAIYGHPPSSSTLIGLYC